MKHIANFPYYKPLEDAMVGGVESCERLLGDDILRGQCDC